MAAFRILFFVILVALAAGPRAEAVTESLLTPIVGLVHGTVVCPPNATIGIGTSHPASNGSLVQLKCRIDLLGPVTAGVTTDALGRFNILVNLTSTATVSNILDNCSLVVSDPLSRVCNISSATQAVLTSTLTFVTNTIIGVVGQVACFVPSGFRVTFEFNL